MVAHALDKYRLVHIDDRFQVIFDHTTNFSAFNIYLTLDPSGVDTKASLAHNQNQKKKEKKNVLSKNVEKTIIQIDYLLNYWLADARLDKMP